MNDILKDFYSTKVRLFPNLGRELEVDDGPEPLYRAHEENIGSCSEPGKEFHLKGIY